MAARLGRTDLRVRESRRRIVSVEGDVDSPNWRLPAFGVGNLGGDALGEGDSAAANPDQSQILEARGSFQNGDGNAPDTSLNRVGVEDDRGPDDSGDGSAVQGATGPVDQVSVGGTALAWETALGFNAGVLQDRSFSRTTGFTVANG